jgi:hypothetical protein
MAGIATIPSSTLRSELRRRETAVRRLERKRSTLLARLARFDQQLRSMGENPGGRGGGGGRRPKNEMTLTEALEKVLKGRTMGVPDIADAVLKSGYRTNSSKFRTQVNIALIKNGFKRTGRGMYSGK